MTVARGPLPKAGSVRRASVQGRAMATTVAPSLPASRARSPPQAASPAAEGGFMTAIVVGLEPGDRDGRLPAGGRPARPPDCYQEDTRDKLNLAQKGSS